RWSCLSFALILYGAAPARDVAVLSLHDALPILQGIEVVLHGIGDARRGTREGVVQCLDLGVEGLIRRCRRGGGANQAFNAQIERSEEHTSELQSRENLVCRLLLEKKKQHCFPRI